MLLFFVMLSMRTLALGVMLSFVCRENVSVNEVSEAAQQTENDLEIGRTFAKELAAVESGSKKLQRESLIKSIDTFASGKELSLWQSLELANNFSSFDKNIFFEFLHQTSRDLHNPEAELYKRIDSNSRDKIIGKLTRFLQHCNARADLENKAPRLDCSDLAYLPELMQLKPEVKLVFAENFLHHAFPKNEDTLIAELKY